MLLPTRHLHALIITALIFVLIGAVRLVTFNIHYFDPFNNGIRDYEITDILFSQLRDPERVDREDRIVLVHVAKPQRAEIAELLTKIGSRSPRVIGVDILFSGRKDPVGDSLLAAAISATPSIVMASNLAPYDGQRKGIPGMIYSDSIFTRGARSAYTNFLAGTDRTVRLFNPFITTLDGRQEVSFGAALAQAYAPDRVGKLRWQRGERPVRINYSGGYRGFLRVDGGAILETEAEDPLAVFRDRIVIIGFIDSQEPDAPIEDRYFTPLNEVYTGRSLPDMYGAVIHANIVSMILDGSYIFELPGWLEALLVVGFTYVNVLVIHRIYHRLPDSYHGVTRVMQLVELFCFFFIVALLFYHFRLKIDFSTGFLALVLAYDIVMIYESFIRKRIPALNPPDHV